ncbi:hypothetical protein GBA52_028993 [Prunus armeniaca]|nr:hypothetical protein GBA52_028993 [Prunus armeniaca]
MMSLVWGSSSPPPPPPEAAVSTMAKKCGAQGGLLSSSSRGVVSNSSGAVASRYYWCFPHFFQRRVEKIKDPLCQNLGSKDGEAPRTEWRCAYPLLEEAGLEAWAVDVLGWGFSDLGAPPCSAASKRHHLYQFWKSYIRRPMILVGPSLGASVAIDFAVHHPIAVEKLVLINASVYAEGTGDLAKLPKFLAYAGVSLLKSIPLRLYANLLAFNGISLSTTFDWTNVGRLHCLLPWWKDATVSFMSSGGYNVISQIKQVKQKALVICSEQDHIISYKQILRLRCELPYAIMRLIPDSGHLPHVENPTSVVKLIAGFARNDCC